MAVTILIQPTTYYLKETEFLVEIKNDIFVIREYHMEAPALNTENLLNIVVNVTLRHTGVTRDLLTEQHMRITQDVTDARTIIVKVSYALNIPISAIRRVLKRDNNTVVYYLAHDVDEMKLYEIKKEIIQYVDLMEKGTSDEREEDKTV